MHDTAAAASSLRDAHDSEDARRDERRRMRYASLAQVQEQQRRQVERALQRSLARHVPLPSRVERDVYEQLRPSMTQWDALCARALARRGARAAAAAASRAHTDAHAAHTQRCATRLLRAVVDDDTRRCAHLTSAAAAADAARRRACVDACVTRMLRAVDAYADASARADVDGHRYPFFAQCLLHDVLRNHTSSDNKNNDDNNKDDNNNNNDGTPQCVRQSRDADDGDVDDAFAALLGCRDALSRSSAAVTWLLAGLYRSLAKPSTLALATSATTTTTTTKTTTAAAVRRRAWSLCCRMRVPLIAVVGPPHSGTAALTRHLVNTYGFRCVRDDELVQRALRAYNDGAAAATTTTTAEATCDGAAVRHDAWAVCGHDVHATLRGGGAVSATTLATLLALQLHEWLQPPSQQQEQEQERDHEATTTTTCACRGIVLDNVVRDAETYAALHDALLQLQHEDEQQHEDNNDDDEHGQRQQHEQAGNDSNRNSSHDAYALTAAEVAAVDATVPQWCSALVLRDDAAAYDDSKHDDGHTCGVTTTTTAATAAATGRHSVPPLPLAAFAAATVTASADAHGKKDARARVAPSRSGNDTAAAAAAADLAAAAAAPAELPAVDAAAVAALQHERVVCAQAMAQLLPRERARGGDLFALVLHIDEAPATLFARAARSSTSRDNNHNDKHDDHNQHDGDDTPRRRVVCTAPLHHALVAHAQAWPRLRDVLGVATHVCELHGNHHRDEAACDGDDNDNNDDATAMTASYADVVHDAVTRALAAHATRRQQCAEAMAADARARALASRLRRHAAAREVARLRLLEQYIERGVPVPAEIAEATTTTHTSLTSGNHNNNAVATAATAAADAMLRPTSPQTPSSSSQQQQQQAPPPSASSLPCLPPSSSTTSLSMSLSLPPPPPSAATTTTTGNAVVCIGEDACDGVPQTILRALVLLTRRYRATYATAWSQLRRVACALCDYHVAAQAQLQRFWREQPDDKQAVLDRFVQAYHTMTQQAQKSSNNNSSRKDDDDGDAHDRRTHVGGLLASVRCKEELHLCVDELRDALVACNASKRRACLARVAHMTRRSTALDAYVAAVSRVGLLLVRAELARVATTCEALVLYYNAFLPEPLLLTSSSSNGSSDDDATTAAAANADAERGTNTTTTTTASSSAVSSAAATRMTSLLDGAVGGVARAAATTTMTTTTTTGGDGSAAGARAARESRKLAGSAAKKSAAAAATTTSSAGGGNSSSSAASGGGNSAAAATTAAAGGGNTTASARADDAAAHAAEEAFVDAVQRLWTSASSNTAMALLTQLRNLGDGGARVPRKTLSTAVVRATLFAARVLPLLERELAVAAARVARVRHSIRAMLRAGHAYAQALARRLHADTQARCVAQASAVHTAIYTLHCAIEAEAVRLPAMHLGCDTFALLSPPRHDDNDDNNTCSDEHAATTTTTAATTAAATRSFLTDVPLYGQLAVVDVALHPTLTATRLAQLIGALRAVAPTYQLARHEYMLLVTDELYASDAVSLSSRHRRRLRTAAELFGAFDVDDVGVLDWRELVVHLLFWCPHAVTTTTTATPSSDRVRELTLHDLRQLKRATAQRELSAEAFAALPLWLDDHVDATRRVAYRQLLWLALHDAARGTLDSYVLLYFLCSDVQRVRGAQKAFCALSPARHRSSSGHTVSENANDNDDDKKHIVDDDDEAMSMAELARAVHVRATSSLSAAVGMRAAFCHANLRLLYAARDDDDNDNDDNNKRLTFADVCGHVMGRKLLNSTDAFQRKSFVRDNDDDDGAVAAVVHAPSSS